MYKSKNSWFAFFYVYRDVGMGDTLDIYCGENIVGAFIARISK